MYFVHIASTQAVCDAPTTVSTTSTYLPAQSKNNLAEAVPGIEEEYPCTSCSSATIQKGLYGV